MQTKKSCESENSMAKYASPYIMKSKNRINILLGNVRQQCSSQNVNSFRNMASKCDIICINHNFEEPDLNSVLSIGYPACRFRKYQEFHRVNSTPFTPLLNKILTLFKIKLNNKFVWYSYIRGHIYLENSSKVKFEVPGDHYLHEQRIYFWEFDMRSCLSNFKRLILGSVNFTHFRSAQKQELCIKSLRYSIKEVVWKNFISELIFNPQMTFIPAEDNIVTFNLSDHISFMICGEFSNSTQLKDFQTLLGHGELIQLDKNRPQPKKSNNYFLKNITFSREDILYFTSVFPVSKVIGPDFNDYCIPEELLNIFDLHSLKSNPLSHINGIICSQKNSNPKFIKFVFYDNANITETFVDSNNNSILQIVSL